MAGHSKWANIKHRKARQDAKRGTLWSKCARAIIVAAKNGGPDPDSNLTLRYAIDEAKAANMPKDTIENAIKKGSGEAGGANYENTVYEGYGPGGVAVMLEILTDNRNRTAGEVRKIFEKGSGNLGTTGCVAYNFQPRGQIFVSKNDTDEETLMQTVLEAGADDIADDGESWQILTDPGDYLAVKDAVDQASIVIESSSVAQVPNNTVTTTGNDARKLLRLVETLEDHDDVQKVYANFEIPDEEMAALQEDV